MCGADAAALSGLVEGSLVRRSEDGRYRMLLTIREYALERLSERAEADEVRRRHAEYFVELGEQLVAALPATAAIEAYATSSSASTTTSGLRSRSRPTPP